MKQPYYEKIDGRPLVYLLGGYRTDYIDRLNTLCIKHQLPAPYIVFFNSSVEAESEGGDYSRATAVSRYSCVVKGVKTCKEFFDDLILQDRPLPVVNRQGTFPYLNHTYDPTFAVHASPFTNIPSTGRQA